MKRLLIYGGLLLAGFGVSGCYRDVLFPPASLTEQPKFESFSGDLQPLFTSSCALSGCHVSGTQTPYLSEDLSFTQLTGGFVNTIVPTDSKLYIAINGVMLPHIPLASDRQKIYDWIRNGAPNN